MKNIGRGRGFHCPIFRGLTGWGPVTSILRTPLPRKWLNSMVDLVDPKKNRGESKATFTELGGTIL